MGTHATATSAAADSLVIHDDIAYLASDRLEGRLTGTAGNDSAAAYLARRYSTLKLRQGSPGYLQKFVARSAADAHAGVTTGRPTQNVIAILSGSDPRFAGKYIVIGAHFDHLAAASGIRILRTPYRAPRANAVCKRFVGSVRRGCLDHVLVLGERHLRRILTTYLTYYHGSRTHLSLEKDAPTPRRVQTVTEGDVIAFPEVGGLHHRYERRAA